MYMLRFGGLLIAAAFAVLASRFIALQMRKRQARCLYGCQEPVKYPHTDWLWGSDLLKLRKQALREGRLKLLYLEHHRTLGDTWQEIANGGVRINTIAGPNLQYVYAQHMSNFPRGNLPTTSTLLFGKGGLLRDGDEWKWTRRMIMPTFSKYEKRTMPMLKTHVDRFMKNLPPAGQTFDAQPLVKRLFLDLATEFLFGEPLGMQLPEKKDEAEDFLRTLDSALLGLNKRRQDFSITTIKLWFDGSYAANVAKVHAFIDARVQAALDRTMLDKNHSDNSSEAGRYILADELARQIRDPEYLRTAMIQCFLPGRDSTAILVSNTLFELARHPEHWERLRPLALAMTEEDRLSFQKLSNVHPIRNVILEALRFHGPGGPNRRTVKNDVILPQGGGPHGKSPLFVPKGAQIVTHLPAMHRNRGYWGDDADEYHPERFAALEPDWEFRPFLGGPQICPAKDQALAQATYILIRLLTEFVTIENRDPVQDFIEISKLTTESRRGVQIALIPARSNGAMTAAKPQRRNQ